MTAGHREPRPSETAVEVGPDDSVDLATDLHHQFHSRRQQTFLQLLGHRAAQQHVDAELRQQADPVAAFEVVLLGKRRFAADHLDDHQALRNVEYR